MGKDKNTNLEHNTSLSYSQEYIHTNKIVLMVSSVLLKTLKLSEMQLASRPMKKNIVCRQETSNNNTLDCRRLCLGQCQDCFTF